MIFRPPIYAILYLIVGFILKYIFPEATIIKSPYTYLGYFIIVLSIFLVAIALINFKKQDTTKDPSGTPTSLVISFPFNFTRNPMYVGLTLILLGIAITAGNLYLFIAPLAFLVTINFAIIPREEKIMEKIFSQEYLNYKKRVRRWI